MRYEQNKEGPPKKMHTGMTKSLAQAHFSSGHTLSSQPLKMIDPKEKGRPRGRPEDVAQLSIRLEIEPNRQLGNAVTTLVSSSRKHLSEGRAVIHEIRIRIEEIGMVQKIKEVGIEPEP